MIEEKIEIQKNHLMEGVIEYNNDSQSLEVKAIKLISIRSYFMRVSILRDSGRNKTLLEAYLSFMVYIINSYTSSIIHHVTQFRRKERRRKTGANGT